MTEPYDASTIFEPDPVLGRYVSHHPSDRIRLMIIGAVAYGTPVAIINLLIPGATGFTAAVIVAFYGVLALAVGWYVMHLWNREVIIYEQGFTYREGSRLAYFHFTEIIGFRQQAQRISYLGLVQQERWTYTITTMQGETLKLTNLYNNIKKLGDQLEKRITRIRKPIVEERLRRGETIAFGQHIALTQAGIVAGDRTLNYADFAGVRSQSGQLVIAAKQDAAWVTVPAPEVENLLLLVSLLRDQQTKQQEAES